MNYYMESEQVSTRDLTLGWGAAGYDFTRSPDAADLSMAAMTSWRWRVAASRFALYGWLKAPRGGSPRAAPF
jgi:hypothetical protein